jgi:NitT/TauT family transport system permease protein
VPRRLPSAAWTALVVLLLLAAVQVVSWFTPRYVFPDVPMIWDAVVEIVTEDYQSILSTLTRFFIALFAAMMVGWLLGLLMATFRNTVGELLRPVFSIMQAVPALSWVLISVIWLHSIEVRVLFIVFVIGVPFFVISVYEGIRNTDHDMVEAVNQFRPSRWQVLTYLFVPQSVSYVIITLRSASSFCLRILVFAELIGATTGVGYEMGQAQANFRIDLIFGWTVLLIIFNFALMGAIDLLEKRLLRWRKEAVVR